MYSINEWRARYEVSLKGREPKGEEELRVGPLAYVRLKIYGHRQGAGYRRLQQACGERFMEVFGIFCKFLEISGNQPRDKRGGLLNEKDEPATIDDLAFIIGVSVEKIRFAIKSLCDIGWVNSDNTTQLNSIKHNSTQHKGPEISGKNRKPTIEFNYNTHILSGITDLDTKDWAEAFPAVDIKQEIKSARQWLIDNPTKRKTQIRRFLSNWLRRQQEKGGSNNAKGNTKNERSSGQDEPFIR